MSRSKRIKETVYTVLRRVCLDDQTYVPGEKIILQKEDERLIRLAACGVLEILESVSPLESDQDQDGQE